HAVLAPLPGHADSGIAGTADPAVPRRRVRLSGRERAVPRRFMGAGDAGSGYRPGALSPFAPTDEGRGPETAAGRAAPFGEPSRRTHAEASGFRRSVLQGGPDEMTWTCIPTFACRS